VAKLTLQWLVGGCRIDSIGSLTIVYILELEALSDD
jgi:hypothetical protein